jgi:hypothetical protein
MCGGGRRCWCWRLAACLRSICCCIRRRRASLSPRAAADSSIARTAAAVGTAVEANFFGRSCSRGAAGTNAGANMYEDENDDDDAEAEAEVDEEVGLAAEGEAEEEEDEGGSSCHRFE